MPIMRLSLIIIILVVIALPCQAKIYKYQKDGVWVLRIHPPRIRSARARPWKKAVGRHHARSGAVPRF